MNDFTQCLLIRDVHLIMSETRIVDIIEFLDKLSRVMNQNISKQIINKQ